MPIAILNPVSNGAHVALPIQGGASYAAVLKDNLNTTYVYADGSNFGTASVVVAALSASILYPTKVTFEWQAREALADVHNVTPFISDGVNEIFGTARDLGLVVTTYQDIFTTAPDGTPWTTAKLAALQVGIAMSSPSQEQRWIKARVLVEYGANSQQSFLVS